MLSALCALRCRANRPVVITLDHGNTRKLTVESYTTETHAQKTLK